MNIAIFSLNVAKHLIHKGYIVKDIEKNNIYHTKIVFYFEDTEEIQKELQSFIKYMKK